jgi:hypothetical protein
MKKTLARAAGSVLIAVLIGVAGGLWETVAIKRYEAIEGKSLGLFQTPNGNDYRRWGNEAPLIATLLTLCLYAVLGTRIVRAWGTIPLVALWVAAIVVGVGIWYYSALLGMNADGIVF